MSERTRAAPAKGPPPARPSARSSGSPTVAEAGQSTRGRRWVLDDLIESSGLPHSERHLLHTLNRRADGFSGVIPYQFQPSLVSLEQRTGLRHETLLLLLNRLEKRGWLRRDRGTPGRGHRTRYTITPPQTGPGPDPIPATESGPQAGPVRQRKGSAFAEERGPHAGPQLDQRARSVDARAEDTRAVIRQHTDADADEITQLLNHKDIRAAANPAAWCTTAGRNGTLGELLEQLRAGQHQADLTSLRAEVEKGPPCDHGIPGGAYPHPDPPGLPWLCPLCRKAAAAAAGGGS